MKRHRRNRLTRRGGGLLGPLLDLGLESDTTVTSIGTSTSEADLTGAAQPVADAVVALYKASQSPVLSSTSTYTDLSTYLDNSLKAYIVLFTSTDLDELLANTNACIESLDLLSGYCGEVSDLDGIVQASNYLLAQTEALLSLCNGHVSSTGPSHPPPTAAPSSPPPSPVSGPIYLDLHPLLSALALGGIDVKAFIDLGPGLDNLVNGLLAGLNLGGVPPPSAPPSIPATTILASHAPSQTITHSTYTTHTTVSHTIPPTPTSTSSTSALELYLAALIEAVVTLRLDAALLSSPLYDPATASDLVGTINALVKLTLALSDLSTYDELVAQLQTILQTSIDLDHTALSCQGDLTSFGLGGTVDQIIDDTNGVLDTTGQLLKDLNACGCEHEAGTMGGLMAAIYTGLSGSSDILTEIDL
ncbi:hypothetical protein HGRIS_014123 [Hohenbuehelia grisea]